MVFRRFLRVPWTARRRNKSILKEIIGRTEYSLEGMMLKWSSNTLQWVLEKILMLGKTEGRRIKFSRGWGGCMTSLTWWTWVWASFGGWWRTRKLVKDREAWHAAAHVVTKCQTWLNIWTKLNIIAQNYMRIYTTPKFLKSFSMNIKTELRINIKSRFEETFSNHIMPSVSKAIYFVVKLLQKS